MKANNIPLLSLPKGKVILPTLYQVHGWAGGRSDQTVRLLNMLTLTMAHYLKDGTYILFRDPTGEPVDLMVREWGMRCFYSRTQIFEASSVSFFVILDHGPETQGVSPKTLVSFFTETVLVHPNTREILVPVAFMATLDLKASYSIPPNVSTHSCIPMSATS
jgi:hypothetical protein